MTLVVCWLEGERVACAADTRISNGEGLTLTDSGAKIFIVPIEVTYVDRQENNLGKKNHSIGFAFAGSTLLANNAHAIASTCTQILSSTSHEVTLPSLAGVAKYYAKVGEHVVRDLNSRFPGTPSFFEMLLFGWCPVQQRLQVAWLHPALDQISFRMELEVSDIPPGSSFSIGSGAALFRAASKQQIDASAKVTPMGVFREILNSGHLKDVGGFIQVAYAGRDGTTLQPILIQDSENPDLVKPILMGFDLGVAGPLDGHNIGQTHLGLGTEKVMARAALRMRGIDPDAGPVSKDVQNLASIEMALAVVADPTSPPTALTIDDNYRMAAIRPAMGNTYLAGDCSCGEVGVFCKLPPAPAPMPKITSQGSLQTTCWHCGTQLSAQADGLRRMTWNRPTR